ncbi:Uncharacterised protein [Chlamydia trachomatis]|nr:Uncharacterised protein [Chlamydia trachomatis]
MVYTVSGVLNMEQEMDVDQLNFLAAKICWCVCNKSMCFAKILRRLTLKI